MLDSRLYYYSIGLDEKKNQAVAQLGLLLFLMKIFVSAFS